MIARDRCVHIAFPTALCALRLPDGSLHSGGNPIKTADSAAVMTRTVLPSRSHHVSAWLAHTVNPCSSTDLTHAVPSRFRVWFLKCEARTSIPCSSNASRTDTRRAEGISCKLRMTLGGAAMRRQRVCGAPKSAASKIAKPTRSGKRLAYSASTARVVGVLTFSRDHEKSPRPSTRSNAHRITCTPPSTSAAAAEPTEPLRAGEKSVHGGLAWMWRDTEGGGN